MGGIGAHCFEDYETLKMFVEEPSTYKESGPVSGGRKAGARALCSARAARWFPPNPVPRSDPKKRNNEVNTTWVQWSCICITVRFHASSGFSWSLKAPVEPIFGIPGPIHQAD